jgi:hypothetical protein
VENRFQSLPFKRNLQRYIVVEDPDSPGSITDFVSFYSLPSTVIQSAVATTLRAAYSYYNVAGKATIARLMEDALILAKAGAYHLLTIVHVFTRLISAVLISLLPLKRPR